MQKASNVLPALCSEIPAFQTQIRFADGASIRRETAGFRIPEEKGKDAAGPRVRGVLPPALPFAMRTGSLPGSSRSWTGW